MRNLIIQELNTVSGTTIMKELPLGTFMRGITTQFVDPSTAEVQTILLCAWKPDVKHGFL